jgi:hypothetical protein
LLWQKSRSHGQDPRIFDAVRGGSKMLYPSITNAEETDAQFITAFGSDGFTMGTAGGNANDSGTTYVAWCWKESATAGFDIVTYTGNGTDDTDISHNLSAVPHVIICKVRDVAGEQWKVYHHKNTSAPETDFLRLEDTAATADDASVWSDEAPTSSVFTLGDTNGINQNTKLFVSYLWTSIQGFSAFGKFEGNQNADGTFVYTGFKPAMVIIKNIDRVEGWSMFDTKRNPGNLTDNQLRAESSVATDVDSSIAIDILSNGFKLRTTSTEINHSTCTYMAWAEAPLVNSNGVPCNAR